MRSICGITKTVILMLESDVVTGKMNKDRYTPEGVWQLFFKQEDRTLIGDINPKTINPPINSRWSTG